MQCRDEVSEEAEPKAKGKPSSRLEKESTGINSRESGKIERVKVRVVHPSQKKKKEQTKKKKNETAANG